MRVGVLNRLHSYIVIKFRPTDRPRAIRSNRVTDRTTLKLHHWQPIESFWRAVAAAYPLLSDRDVGDRESAVEIRASRRRWRTRSRTTMLTTDDDGETRWCFRRLDADVCGRLRQLTTMLKGKKAWKWCADRPRGTNNNSSENTRDDDDDDDEAVLNI